MATSERRDTLDSQTVAVGPGSRVVEANFGERKMTLRRERFAESLFRNCGLGAIGGNWLLSTTTTAAARTPALGWDAAGAASVSISGRSFRSRDGGAAPISSAVVDRNKVVAQSNKVMAKRRGAARVQDQSDRRDSIDGDQVGFVDSKALAAEIESVAAELRNLISGIDTDYTGGGMTASGGKSEAKDEDEEDGGGQKARLLRYRYVRKIQAPVPPLEPLDESWEQGPREVDKIERNMQGNRIRWYRDAQERATHWNRESSARTESAKSRRDEEIEKTSGELMQHLLEKESKAPVRAEALRNEQVARLKAKTAAREERLEQVRRRREEEQFAKEQRLVDDENQRTMRVAESSQSAGRGQSHGSSAGGGGGDGAAGTKEGDVPRDEDPMGTAPEDASPEEEAEFDLFASVNLDVNLEGMDETGTIAEEQPQQTVPEGDGQRTSA